MKKILATFIVGCLFTCFFACHNKIEDPQTSKKPNKDRVFNSGDSLSSKTTPVGYAEACAEEYDRLYDPKGPNDDAIEAAYTESVGFYGPELLKYLNGIDSLEKREIRMVLGVYVDPDKYNLTAAAGQKVDPDDYRKRMGRLTVFVWPTPIGYGHSHGHGHGHGGHVGDDCEQCSPLNFGNLNP